MFSPSQMRRAAKRIEELEKDVFDLREILNTLVYWNEQGHIDESWWRNAKTLIDDKKLESIEQEIFYDNK